MKIADITVEYVDHMGNDDSVANAARVSFAKIAANYTPEQNAKLINYLAKHKHYSPFNHTFLSFRIKAPIFVSRQLVKHEYLPWNEVSRRYVDSEPEFYIPEILRSKADNVKQGSTEEAIPMNKYILIGTKVHTQNCLDYYNILLENEVCPEQARMVLPLNTMTEWIWSGTLKAFHKMLDLRLDPHAQYESRIVAQLIHKEAEALFPVSLKSLMENK